MFASVNRKQIVNSGQLLGYRKYNEQARELWLLFNDLYNFESAPFCLSFPSLYYQCPFILRCSNIITYSKISFVNDKCNTFVSSFLPVQTLTLKQWFWPKTAFLCVLEWPKHIQKAWFKKYRCTCRPGPDCKARNSGLFLSGWDFFAVFCSFWPRNILNVLHLSGSHCSTRCLHQGCA